MSNVDTTSVQTDTRTPDVTTGRLGTELLTLAGFCAFLFYFGLGSFGLVGADEPRYAQIAREMLARHDWITPVLNGVPWLEKPVLYYWSAMLSYSAFGVSDWAARVPSAVFASAMVVASYFFLRRCRPGAQLDGALILASSAAVIGFARAASTDVPLAAAFTMGMLAWYAWFESGRRRWLAGFYFLMALGVLAKGPVAPFLAALIIILFALLRREPRLIWRTLWWPGVVLFFAVAAPWYVAIQSRHPEFFRSFFLAHNLERFSKDVFHHPQPFWYYLPVLLLSMAPWTVYGIVAIAQGLRRDSHPLPAPKAGAPGKGWGTQTEGVPSSARAGGPHARTAGETPPVQDTGSLPLFLIIWLVAPVVFFSFSQSKLPGYILPAVPAFALLLADYLRRRKTEGKPNFALVALHSAVGGCLLGVFLLVQYFVLKLPPPAAARVVAGVIAAAIFVGMALTLRWRGLRFLRFVTLIPVILGLAFIIRIGAPALDNTQSERPVARELERINSSGMQVAVFKARREVEYGLNFYRNQAVARYERGEIPAGQHLVVAPKGAQAELQAQLPGRRVSWIGEFGPQRLEFFWVSAPGTGHEHHP